MKVMFDFILKFPHKKWENKQKFENVYGIIKSLDIYEYLCQIN